MALTTLDPKPALVVIDLQKGIVAVPTVHPIGRPAFTPAPDWTELVEELDAQPDDHRVTKVRWGAFPETSLDAHRQRLGVTQLVLAGVATSIGVESTARAAHEHEVLELLEKPAER
jgi:nicotinamidase-related amidase